jgi:hypothetical protein
MRSYVGNACVPSYSSCDPSKDPPRLTL